MVVPTESEVLVESSVLPQRLDGFWGRQRDVRRSIWCPHGSRGGAPAGRRGGGRGGDRGAGRRGGRRGPPARPGSTRGASAMARVPKRQRPEPARGAARRPVAVALCRRFAVRRTLGRS